MNQTKKEKLVLIINFLKSFLKKSSQKKTKYSNSLSSTFSHKKKRKEIKKI